MPELPEVNAKKNHFDQVALHQKIETVDLIDTSYILKEISGPAFAEKLTGRTFTGSYRRGKYFFAKLDNGDHILFHFGMSGRFRYYDDPDDQPKYERFAFDFEEGGRLGFDCPRKLARIHYVEDLDAFIAKKNLGEDALVLKEADFLEMAKGRKGTIKGFLLNQKYLAGMGNLYVDEVCWQQGIHPASVMGLLSEEEQRAMFQNMQAILQKAVALDAVYPDYPEEWLWNHRDKGGTCPKDGTELQRDKVAGRSTYYCPQCQELRS
ncbi:MAG: DNA-formamidopyrimidine glycosylase family protein [Phaeodactylibacter sp.]|uniref:Fpg/Nei family DNA glycosylase n=1 Tax=Phaeodactylibacter sp. TaxID=1940289 RepID=UPI0032EEF28E